MNRATRRAQAKSGKSKAKLGLSVLAATSLVSGNVSTIAFAAPAGPCSVADQLELIAAAADLNCEIINVTANITFAEGNAAVINHDVLIQGDFTIDADDLSQIFSVENNYLASGDANNNGKLDVTIKDLSLINGDGYLNNGSGGAITANYQYGDDLPTDLTLDGVTFSDNYAFDEGGAIYLDRGYITSLGGTTFQNNVSDWEGGAVYIGTGSFTVAGATNFANNGYFMNLLNYVGDLNEDGGALYINTGNFVVENGASVTFTSNVADAEGGAVFLNNGSAIINGTATFTNNGKLIQNGNTLETTNEGGALYIQDGEFYVYGTANFTGNYAVWNGGAVYIDRGNARIFGTANFTSNSTNGDGGAMYLYYQSFFVEGTANFTGNSAGARGGAIYLSEGSANVAATGNVTFTNNTAENGGAIYIQNSGIGILGTATFTNNDAYYDGGAIHSEATVAIEGTATFTGNDAGLDLGTNGQGGAVFVDDSFVVFGGDVTFNSNSSDDAGAIFAEGVVVFLGDATGTFTNNSAEFDGGAISSFQVFGEGATTVTFDGNSAGESGGAIVTYAVLSTQSNKFSFTNNSAERGGAVSAVFANFESDYFGGNTAELDGGAIYARESLTVENSTFFENTAGDEGGAIFTENDNNSVIFSTFVNNSAAPTGAETPGQSIYTSGTFKLFGNIFASSNSDLPHLGEGIGGGTPEFTDLGGNLSTSIADESELVHEASKIVTYAELTLANAPAVDPAYPNSTRTIQISTDSLAADAVDLEALAESLELLNLGEGGLPDVDQRGAARTLKFDAGAYEAGESTYRAIAPVIEVAPKVVLPAAPNRVAVKRVGKAALKIEWTAPSTAGTGKIVRYEIYRNGKKIATISANSRSYRDSGLDSQQSYTYRVVTVGTQGKSIKSVNSQAVFPRN